ncbi:hypothetical protein KAR91_85865 [Candidatus Pacearchaeota archaeon]|nr:hypothetical protein [Candidatus Pacearchaeota archaeon]
MKLKQITQNKQYPRGFQLVYKGTFYQVCEHVQGVRIELGTHIGPPLHIMAKDMEDIYIYDQRKESLKWLYRVEQLSTLKKYRIAESKDSGKTWDSLSSSVAKNYPDYKPISTDLKHLKGLVAEIEKQEELEYLSRLGYWKPIK